MRKKVLLAIIVFVVSCYTILSLLFPSPNLEIIKNECEQNDIVATYYLKDITKTENCKLNDKGEIIVENSSPSIVFDSINAEFQTIEIKFAKRSSRAISLNIHLVSDEGGSRDLVSYCSQNTESLVVSVPKARYKSITIGSVSKVFYIFKTFPFTIKELNIHSEKALETKERYVEPNRILYVIIAFASAILLTLIVLLIDKKTDFSNKLMKEQNMVKIRKKFFSMCTTLFLCCIFSIIIEFLIASFIFGPRSDSQLMSIQRAAFICSILVGITSIYVTRIDIKTKPEKLFLNLLLIIGITMIIVAPFGHICWDTDSHYNWVLNASFLKTNIKTNADQLILVAERDGIYWPATNAALNSFRTETFDSASTILYGYSNSKTMLPHVLSGIFLAWARFVGLKYHYCIIFAKFANVLIYSFICYAAMKKLKSGKMILAVIAFIPTSVFIAANFSYDYWVEAFSLLGMAYFIGEMQQPNKPITISNTLLMSGSLALCCVPKLIYCPLLLFPFFMNRKKITEKKKYYGICIGFIVIVCVWFMVHSFFSVTGTGDARGGSGVNSLLQLKFILQNPIEYAEILIKYLHTYLSVNNMPNYITNLAYLGVGKGSIVFIVLFFITMVTDKKPCDASVSNWLIRSYSLILYFALAAAIASVMYITINPVGYETINFCQARYLIPLLYPVLATLGYNKINNPFNENVYNYLVLIPCVSINYYLIYSLMLTCWR